jgi:hypothetical protein
MPGSHGLDARSRPRFAPMRLASASRGAVLLGLVAWGGPAAALTLSLESESSPYPGITLREYRTSSPTTNTFVTLVDLCTSYVHVTATEASDSTQSTGSWASDAGVQVATNGDFYKTSPLRVYGNAVGDGNAWPSIQTGDDSSYSGEWYYSHYGWIAFGDDWVEFTHSAHVKNNLGDYGVSGGWEITDKHPDPPVGTLALVSGFPELVVEGFVETCSDPEASTCFPDRSDMRDRHPRTAMGLTADKGTLILAVVDGRTSDSSGMYGSELADLMGQLGAWVAFNLDGGGSSQMWVDGDGYVNDYDGNNSGGGARSVANHWGVWAGSGSGRAAWPGHCPSAGACSLIPAAGGSLDEEGDCFEKFGPDEYWRDETTGDGGHLYWTNAFKSDDPDNWAWWKLHLEEEGDYLVEVYTGGGFNVHAGTDYHVYADGVMSDVTIDQSAVDGWQALGTYHFAAGGGQFLKVTDNESSTVASSQHIAVDSIRLSRVGEWCGNGICDPSEDCTSCAAECTGPEELLGNGVDDDCDGEIDEVAPEPDSGGEDDSAEPSADSGGSDGAADGGSDGGSGGGPSPIIVIDNGDIGKQPGCSCAAAGSGRLGAAGLGLLLILTGRRRAPGASLARSRRAL